jgi:hypothetical protein
VGQIAAVVTESDAETVAGAFIWAYDRLTGQAPPRRESWVYPLAVASLETAHFVSMYDYNPGNITDGTCGGRVRGTAGWYANPLVTAPLRFAAFRTLGEGCLGELETLSCMGALAAADRGDYGGFMGALETGCYAGCTPYPDLSGVIAQYNALVPKRYSPMTNGQALAIGAGIVALSGGIAYLVTRERPMAAAHANPATERPAARAAMKVQSLLFRKDAGWTVSSAKAWAKKEGYRSGDVDETEEYIHLRQRDPSSMRVIRTKQFGDGISARVGRP